MGQLMDDLDQATGEQAADSGAARGAERSAASTAPQGGYGGVAAVGGGGSGGTSPSITYPPNRQRCGSGGVDWFAVSCWVEWLKPGWSGWMESLDKKKRSLQTAEGKKESPYVDDPRGGVMELHRKGADHGGHFFPFVLDAEGGIQIQLQRVMVPHPMSPNVYVQVGSAALMQRGHAHAWAEIRRLIEALGGTLVNHAVSRIDLCGDVVGLHVSKLVQAHVSGRRITRAAKDRDFKPEEVSWASSKDDKKGQVRIDDFDTVFRRHMRVEGITIGAKSSPLQLRMYDKLKEAQRNPLKWQIMQDMRWGGVVPDAATRVEFQVRREQLRDEFAHGDVDDTLARLPELADYLVHRWYRQTWRKPDRRNGNQARAVLSRPWRQVIDAFSWALDGDAGQPYQPRPLDVGQLAAQMLGLATSAAALEGKTFADVESLFAYAVDKMRSRATPETLKQQQRKVISMRLRQARCEQPEKEPWGEKVMRWLANRPDEV